MVWNLMVEELLENLSRKQLPDGLVPISASDGLRGESLYAGWEKGPEYAGNSRETVWDAAGRIGIIR
jgi:hypothetical protein